MGILVDKLIRSSCEFGSKILKKERCTDAQILTKRFYRLADFACERTKLMTDYTEGYYVNGEHTPYEDAQRLQAELILDSIHCDKNSTILDVGCGNGRILKAAKKRGATAIGITVCQEQVDLLKKQGLEVYLCDVFQCADFFREKKFNGIICNGSLEHFITIKDVSEGKDDQLYRKLFENFSKISVEKARIMTTAIHFKEKPVDLHRIQANLADLKYLSLDWRYAVLTQLFGGFYPTIGQLERCSNHLFKKTFEYDATKDYELTSIDWGKRMARGFKKPRNLLLTIKGLWDLFKTDPYHCYIAMIYYYTSTWKWQFQGEPPPLKHLWNVWEKT